MKRKLFLVCLFLTSIVATKAQNLIENGSFEDGKTNWSGGNIGVESFRDAKDGQKYLESQEDTWGFGGYNANANYRKTVAEGVEGKTYVFSLWVYEGTDLSKLSVNLQVMKSDNTQVYTSANGISFGKFKLEETGRVEGKWKELSKEIQLTNDSHSITRLGMKFTKEKIRVDDVQFVEKKESLQNVQVTDKFQREVVVVWDTASGVTSYTVQVGTVSETVEGSKYLVKGLEPHSATTIIVSAEGFAPTEVVAETVSITTAEADRIPYVKFNNGVASTSFYPHIYDSTNAPTEVKVFLDGTELTADTNGYYTLTVGEGKKLKVTFKDGAQAYELMYIVNVQ